MEKATIFHVTGITGMQKENIFQNAPQQNN